jgi:hypothetical protein
LRRYLITGRDDDPPEGKFLMDTVHFSVLFDYDYEDKDEEDGRKA